MSKHTPGQWSIVIDRRYDQMVEAIEPDVIWGCGCCGSPNLGLSDARLIAAAPDLLEALDWCVSEINRDSPAVLNAKAVMAKARGE